MLSGDPDTINKAKTTLTKVQQSNGTKTVPRKPEGNTGAPEGYKALIKIENCSN